MQVVQKKELILKIHCTKPNHLNLILGSLNKENSEVIHSLFHVGNCVIVQCVY